MSVLICLCVWWNVMQINKSCSSWFIVNVRLSPAQYGCTWKQCQWGGSWDGSMVWADMTRFQIGTSLSHSKWMNIFRKRTEELFPNGSFQYQITFIKRHPNWCLTPLDERHDWKVVLCLDFFCNIGAFSNIGLRMLSPQWVHDTCLLHSGFGRMSRTRWVHGACLVHCGFIAPPLWVPASHWQETLSS